MVRDEAEVKIEEGEGEGKGRREGTVNDRVGSRERIYRGYSEDIHRTTLQMN